MEPYWLRNTLPIFEQVEKQARSRADWSTVCARPASCKTQDPWTKTKSLCPQRPEQILGWGC